ncbi:recombinase family protein, partial [Roseibium sp. RKSG952]|uniref:recombinase family protein n=1 Tax=Roseibium sp. RKSG952 TaxID=2529384 RepID=UPI0012BD818B
MALLVALYARYSSILQDASSIKDQIRLCQAYAESQGWKVTAIYSDKEASGQSAARPDYQRMLRDSKAGAFDIVLAESIDRLSRRTADITDLRDQLAFQGQLLYAVNVGEITQFHAAILGVVAEQFSKDLGAKTKRGQVGSTHRGRVAAGIAYGYDVSPATDQNRVINVEKAEVVRRIFEDFANGLAPAKIASSLNAEGVSGPSGGLWQSSTIRGNAKRQTGILRNRASIGQVVYGQMRFRKDPKTGKRTSIPGDNPLTVDAPDLRIVPQGLWDAVANRLKSISREMDTDPETGLALNRSHRKKFLLSGLLKCGCCRGNMAIQAKDRYGCSNRKRTGACDNATTITRQQVEGCVLASLKSKLLAPENLEAFITRVSGELNALQKSEGDDRKALEKAIAALDLKMERILDQIKDGAGQVGLLLPRLEQRRTEREALAAKLDALKHTAEEPFEMPDLPAAYGALVRSLEDTLRNPDVVQRAHEALSGMIETAVLTPDHEALDGYAITLHGDCVGILGAYGSVPKEKLPGAVLRAGSQFSVVAGAGFEPA